MVALESQIIEIKFKDMPKFYPRLSKFMDNNGKSKIQDYIVFRGLGEIFYAVHNNNSDGYCIAEHMQKKTQFLTIDMSLYIEDNREIIARQEGFRVSDLKIDRSLNLCGFRFFVTNER